MANLAVASANGEHVIVDGGEKNAQLSSGASWMLETRGATGWSGTPIGPPPGADANVLEQNYTSFAAVSEEFRGSRSRRRCRSNQNVIRAPNRRRFML